MRLGLREKVLAYLLTGGLVITGLAVVMVSSLQEKSKQELTRYAAERYVQLHKEKTLGGIQADLALARKMADNQAMRSWVRNPSDPVATGPAMDELRSLISLFSTHAAFVGSKSAAAFYFVDKKALANVVKTPLKPAHTLTKEDKDDEWFFATMGQKDSCNFNIDHNNKLKVTKLWINVVMEDAGEPIGVVGTGIDISKFIDDFIKTSDKGVSGMFVNADGAIQGHADPSLIALNAPVSSDKQQSTIWKLLPDEEERQALRRAMANLPKGQRNSELLTLTLGGKPQVAAIAYLPPLKWFAIATLDRSAVVSGGQLVPTMGILALALIIGGVLVFIGGNRLVILPLRTLAEATRRITQGDYSVRLSDDRSDEIGEVSVTFNRMAEALIESQRKLKSNASAISAALQRAESFAELSQLLFTHLTPELQIGQGSLYRLAEDSSRLVLCGGFARIEGGFPDQEIDFGFGLVGQCALDRRAMDIHNPPADYVRVDTGLGSAVPRCIVLRPIMSTDNLLGVLEIVLLKPLDDAATALFDDLLPMLAMNLEILERTVRTQSLLQASTAQAEMLEQQQLELFEASVKREEINRTLQQQVDELAEARRSLMSMMEALETSKREIEEKSLQTQSLLDQTTRQAEELLKQRELIKETEAWYRDIIESAPDGLLIIDTNGTIILTNTMLDSMFGYQRDELPGQSLERLVPENIHARHISLREGFMQSDTQRTMGRGLELTGLRKDGSLFPLEVGLSILPALEKQERCCCATVRDITERKIIQDELKQNMDELQRFNQLTINREERMIELKEEINMLLKQAGRDPKYRIIEKGE